MRLEFLQANNGEQRIYLGVQGSVHAYLRLIEPDTWAVAIMDLENKPTKQDELTADIQKFIAKTCGLDSIEDLPAVKWSDLVEISQHLEQERPSFAAIALSASYDDFKSRTGREPPKKWKKRPKRPSRALQD